MKILVTGGAGFIGSHIAEAFVDDGHDVLVVDNFHSGKRENVPARARFVEMDIRSPSFVELIKSEKPDAISHHAAQMDVRVSVASPVFDADVNVIGTLHVLESAMQAKVGKVLFASSGGAVYGDKERLPTPEDDDPSPISPYGVSKRAAELYLHYYSAVHGLDYVALRYANVYGPRQDPHGEAGVVAIFAQRILDGEPPGVNGDGRQTRDYVFVKDVVAANVAALARDFVGAVNVGTGKETDVVTLAHELVRLSGKDLQPVHRPAKLGEQRRSVVDPSLARRALGWEAKVTLEDGLRRTFEWFRDRREKSPI
jgi:UDP-glucose 4-epimerase